MIEITALDNIITGNLRTVYEQLQPGTMLHVDQLMNERRTNPIFEAGWDLCEQIFHTADGQVYFLDDFYKTIYRTPTLAITREVQNPVLQNINDAFDQLINNCNYCVLQRDFDHVLASPDTVLISLPQLRLSVDTLGLRGRLIIRTEDGFIKTKGGYQAPNKEEQKVKGRFGYTSENLKMLRDSRYKIKETGIFFLTPDYVCKHAKKDPIARASSLCSFEGDSDFDADYYGVIGHDSARGVCGENKFARAFRY